MRWRNGRYDAKGSHSVDWGSAHVITFPDGAKVFGDGNPMLTPAGSNDAFAVDET